MKENLALRDKDGLEKVRESLLSLRGRTLMQGIREEIDGMQHIETKLLASRKDENGKQIANFRTIYFTSVCFMTILLISLIYAIYKNIIARNKAELALHQSLKDITDYKLALDESSLVTITDNNGVIKFANDKFCQVSQYGRDELIGQDHRIINSGFHPKKFIGELWKTISDGKVWRGEIKNKTKDSTFFWVDTTIVPFLDEKDNNPTNTSQSDSISQREN